jgi:hypothetical protein
MLQRVLIALCYMTVYILAMGALLTWFNSQSLVNSLLAPAGALALPLFPQLEFFKTGRSAYDGWKKTNILEIHEDPESLRIMAASMLFGSALAFALFPVWTPFTDPGSGLALAGIGFQSHSHFQNPMSVRRSVNPGSTS